MKLMWIVFAAIFSSLTSVAQVVDESNLLVFVSRTHVGVATGTRKTCLRVSDTGDFRLEILSNASSKRGEVFEGAVPPQIISQIRTTVDAEETRSLGNITNMGKPIMITDSANIVYIVIPRTPHQTIVLTDGGRKTTLPNSVHQLVDDLEAVDKIKGSKIKNAEPQFCKPLDERAPIYH
jgi:hypothetical protein